MSADYVKGFGGKFGVQTDRQDKSALGWDHQEKLQLHESQKGTGSDFCGFQGRSKKSTVTGTESQTCRLMMSDLIVSVFRGKSTPVKHKSPPAEARLVYTPLDETVFVFSIVNKLDLVRKVLYFMAEDE